MVDDDPFGGAGGSRCIDDIGNMVGADGLWGKGSFMQFFHSQQLHAVGRPVQVVTQLAACQGKTCLAGLEQQMQPLGRY